MAHPPESTLFGPEEDVRHGGQLIGGAVVMRPQQVEDYLQSTTIDLVNATDEGDALKGYDECFGNGHVDGVGRGPARDIRRAPAGRAMSGRARLGR